MKYTCFNGRDKILCICSGVIFMKDREKLTGLKPNTEIICTWCFKTT